MRLKKVLLQFLRGFYRSKPSVSLSNAEKSTAKNLESRDIDRAMGVAKNQAAAGDSLDMVLFSEGISELRRLEAGGSGVHAMVRGNNELSREEFARQAIAANPETYKVPEPPPVPMVYELMNYLEQGGDADVETNRVINQRSDSGGVLCMADSTNSTAVPQFQFIATGMSSFSFPATSSIRIWQTGVSE